MLLRAVDCFVAGLIADEASHVVGITTVSSCFVWVFITWRGGLLHQYCFTFVLTGDTVEIQGLHCSKDMLHVFSEFLSSQIRLPKALDNDIAVLNVTLAHHGVPQRIISQLPRVQSLDRKETVVELRRGFIG